MKNIKLRSWSESDKCFYYFINGEYFNDKGEPSQKLCFNWENAERFTEIHDKNGKEIYEGDVSNRGIIKFGTIEIFKNEGGMSHEEKYHGFYIESKFKYPLNTIYSEWPEIIGRRFFYNKLVEA